MTKKIYTTSGGPLGVFKKFFSSGVHHSMVLSEA